MLSLDFSSTNIHMRLKIVLFPVPIYTAYSLFCSVFFLKQLFVALFCQFLQSSHFMHHSQLLFFYFALMIWSCVHLQFTFVYCINRHFISFYLALPFVAFYLSLSSFLSLSLPLSACVTFALCSFQKSIDCSFWQGILFECVAAVKFRYSFAFVAILPNFDRQSKASVDTQNWQKWSKLLFFSWVCVYQQKHWPKLSFSHTHTWI